MERDEMLTRLGATVVAGILSGLWMFQTGGQSGIGWFIFALFIIW